MKTNLEKLQEATAIQCSDGNWNCDPYMQGMANGMIFAVACMKGEEPKYLDAPKEWLSSKPNIHDTELRVKAFDVASIHYINDDGNRGFNDPAKVIANAKAIYNFMKGNENEPA